MADNTQTNIEFFALQEHTHLATDVSQVDDGGTHVVASFISGTLYVFHANIETDANLTGVQYILQGQGSAVQADDDWVDIVRFQTGTTAAAQAQISGAESATSTTIEVDANPTAAYTSGTIIYIQDSGTIADSEWGRVSHSTTAPDVVELVDGLTNAKDAADLMHTQAELFVANVELGGFRNIRMLMLHTAATGSDIHFKAYMTAVTDVE